MGTITNLYPTNTIGERVEVGLATWEYIHNDKVHHRVSEVSFKQSYYKDQIDLSDFQQWDQFFLRLAESLAPYLQEGTKTQFTYSQGSQDDEPPKSKE